MLITETSYVPLIYVSQLNEEVADLAQQALLASFGSTKIEKNSRLGILYQEEPSTKDDLEQIYGISPELQLQLHKLGVFRFKQIALWTDENITNFQKDLNFDGNIQRERWATQAENLTD